MANTRSSNSLDTTATLELGGTRQRVRLCGARKGLPPVLVAQAGPGLPLLNEVPKYQQRLNLEQDYSVAYWDQRGCGNAPSQDASTVSLTTQLEDCCAVVRWLAEQTGQGIVVLGISLGATVALQAAVREASRIKAVVAVSIDTDIPAGDAAAAALLQEASTQPQHRDLEKSLRKLGPPPYTTPEPMQLRARLLADVGGIEHGKRFVNLVAPFLWSLLRTYGVLGAIATLRNMDAVQRKVLPEFATFNLFANWPRRSVPVHYIFGDRDPLISKAMIQRIADLMNKRDTVATASDAGHMVHFDQPAMVRSLIVQAHSRS